MHGMHAVAKAHKRAEQKVDKKKKRKVVRTTFEKRKRVYNPGYHYIEDVEYPSRWQRFFLVVKSPFWFNLILALTFIDAMLYTHAVIVCTERLLTTNQKYQLMFEIIVSTFKVTDIFLAVVVDFVMKLEYLCEARRPIWVLVCECIGALQLYPPIPTYVIRAGHLFKFVRLLYHSYALRISLKCHFIQRVLNFIISLFIWDTLYAWIYFHISNRKPSWETYVQLFEISSAAIVGKGGVVSMVHHYTDSIWLHEVPLACGNILVLFIFLKPTLCDLIRMLCMQYENKFRYIFKVHFFETVIVPKYKCNAVVRASILTYLENIWTELQGWMKTPEMEQAVRIVFPRALIMEMSLDAYYDFFRHSQIFRDVEIPVMRNMALRIKNLLLMKGEYLFVKRRLVSSMIYIKSGVIEILSCENGDVGIIALTSGTVLGETSLLFPYKCKVNVRCQSICHILALERQDFSFLVRHYPEIYKDILNILKSRLNLAKNINLYKTKPANAVALQEQIVWLKATLHTYKALKSSIKDFHLMRNIYLGPYLAGLLKKQDPLCHTLRCLDMLSIKQRVDIAVDLTFIRSKCIWILKPNSPIYRIWHGLIAILAVVMLILQPYVVFHEHTVVLTMIIIGINLLFAIDLLLSFITPNDYKSSAITLSEICAEQFKSVGMYLDVCSIFYFSLFGHCFPFANEKWIFIFHTVKIWKVYRIFSKCELRFKVNLLFQKCFVFIFTQFIYVYTLGFILKLDNIIESYWDPAGIQIATGVGFKIRSGLMKTTILYTFINTIAAVFEGVAIVTITAANYMQYIKTGRVYRSLQRLYHLCKKHPDSQLFKRLDSFLNTQINDNSAFTCTYDINRLFNFSDHYNQQLKSYIYFTALMDLEFFNYVPQDVVRKVSTSAETHVFHQHSLVVSYGTKYDEIYILIRGQARTVYGDKFYITQSFKPLNLLEVLYGLPCTSSVVAITEVEVVSFAFKTYMQYLSSHKLQLAAMAKALEIQKQDGTLKTLYSIINSKQVVIKTLATENKESYRIFSLKNVYEDSFEEFDYYAPYDRSSAGFLKYMLMKRTFLPNGKFLFWWEVLRGIFAYLTCLVFFVPPISLQVITHPFTAILIFLDITAWADIYVRLHVCYYNEEGLLITHPLYTAKNYIRKAFLVDFLASIPCHLLVHDSPQYKIILNVLHVFQIYRLIGFKLHYFYTNYVLDHIFIILIIILTANFITCLIFVLDCYDWQNEENIEIQCRDFTRNSPLEIYITITYCIMSALTCSGTGSVVDLENVPSTILHIISACSFASTFLHIYVTAYLFASYNKIYIGRYKYRDKIRRLMTFLRNEHVKPYLRKQFKIYYELKWRWIHRINPFFVVKNLNPALRRDMFYCLYGEHMHKHTILVDVSNQLKNFYKNVLFDTNPLVIPKNGYILTINDVQSDIFFIQKGSVDVVAANGTVIETIYDGSIIGNLDNVKYFRQKVSFVTNTVTKLLYLDAMSFHDILNQFPIIKKSFVEIKIRKIYYIPSTYIEDEYQKKQWTWTKDELKAGYAKYKVYHILSWFHFVFPCCIGVPMELYQIATGEMHYTFLITQYIFDAIHLVHQYKKFVTPYMSQEQEFVMHPLRIRAHSMRRKRIYYKLYFVNLPFDVPLLLLLIILQQDIVEWSILFSTLRLNRLSRCVNIASVYYTGTKKVASSSRVFKLFLLFLLLIYSSQIIATIIAFCDFAYTNYLGMNASAIIQEMPVEHLINSRRGLWDERVMLFGRYWFISLLVHTFSHDNLYYPSNTFFEILFIVIFLYVTVFESFVMMQYYQILTESHTLVKIVYAMRQFLQVNYKIKQSAYVLQESVDEAIDYYYTVKSVADDYLMHKDCPKYIRNAAMMSIYGYFFVKHPYFADCHPDFLRQVVGFMKCVVYPINGTIVSRRDCHDTLYFVHKGEVAAIKYENDCTANAVHLYSKGDSFGYQQGFLGCPYQYTYRTVTFCEIVELEWHKCIYLMAYFPMTMMQLQKIMTTTVKHFINPIGRNIKAKKIRI